MSVCNNVSSLLFLCIFLVKMNLLKFLLSTDLKKLWRMSANINIVP